MRPSNRAGDRVRPERMGARGAQRGQGRDRVAAPRAAQAGAAAEPPRRISSTIRTRRSSASAPKLGEPPAAMKTRIHGDYHLGQVLVAQNDFNIIDFEGEPRRPMAERRLKDSPLRDVAGMLRSFDYAGLAAVEQMPPAQRGGPDLAKLALAWRDAASDAFLSAYKEAVAGCPSVPAEMDKLLELFILGKAFYEIRYELANRPGVAGDPAARRVAHPLPPAAVLTCSRIKTLAQRHRRHRAAEHQDPFGFLGMHRTRQGLVVRAIQPAHARSRSSSAARAARSPPSPTCRTRACSSARCRATSRSPIACASPGRRARPRSRILTPSRRCSATSTSTCSRRATTWKRGRSSGAHPITLQGVAGTASWCGAPNARAVSVVGDFNDWDGRRHPMRRRVECGMWESSCPASPQAHATNTRSRRATGPSCRLQSDPYAFTGGAVAAHRLDRGTAVAPTNGATTNGWRSAHAASPRPRRSRSTRSISARGGASPRRRTGRSAIASSPSCWSATCADMGYTHGRAVADQRASVRRNHGAISRPGSTRRPAASAARTISAR